MSGIATFGVALVVSVLVLAYVRLGQRVDQEHEMRLDAEAKADAFEALFPEEAKDRL